jgi:hypothetical protein
MFFQTLLQFLLSILSDAIITRAYTVIINCILQENRSYHSSSPLLALQPCAGLRLLHGFVTVSPTPNPQPGGPGTTLRLAPPL